MIMPTPTPRLPAVRRCGMTLIETLVAVVVLGTALIGMGYFMGNFAHTTKVATLQQRALDLATDRIDSVRHVSNYASIDTMAASETIIADSSTYTRVTMVQHVGGGPTDSLDYRTVTVAVTMPSVTTPARKSTIIAAF
jgi:prepilin-type N-terminal cleavage/methylation domain-containing protein